MAHANDIQDVLIPLFSGRHAAISMPKRMTKRDYDHLRKYVNIMLDGMESYIVEPVSDVLELSTEPA